MYLIHFIMIIQTLSSAAQCKCPVFQLPTNAHRCICTICCTVWFDILSQDHSSSFPYTSLQAHDNVLTNHMTANSSNQSATWDFFRVETFKNIRLRQSCFFSRHQFISVSWYESQLFVLTLFLHPIFWTLFFSGSQTDQNFQN